MPRTRSLPAAHFPLVRETDTTTATIQGIMNTWLVKCDLRANPDALLDVPAFSVETPDGCSYNEGMTYLDAIAFVVAIIADEVAQS
jgi:hypothetical protein